MKLVILILSLTSNIFYAKSVLANPNELFDELVERLSQISEQPVEGCHFAYAKLNPSKVQIGLLKDNKMLGLRLEQNSKTARLSVEREVEFTKYTYSDSGLSGYSQLILQIDEQERFETLSIFISSPGGSALDKEVICTIHEESI